MKIDIICVGKIKEKYFSDACGEYIKRLGRYCKISVTEVPDRKCPENMSDTEKNIVKQREGDDILKVLPSGFVVALDIKGKQLSSEALAEFFVSKTNNGASAFSFIIGGSLGLSDDVLKRADFKLSFSPMTFPHQLMRVVLLEQIYRMYRIINNEPYHK